VLTVISGELAIDLERVLCIERIGGSDFNWVVLFDGGWKVTIRDFERMRIWEILGEKVGSDERYKCNDCV